MTAVTAPPTVYRPFLSGMRSPVVAPLTTIATLQHLDQFHLDTFYGWFWVVAYTIYPIQLGYFLAKQLRTPGEDPPRVEPLPAIAPGVLPPPPEPR
jgi:hypothetical protein